MAQGGRARDDWAAGMKEDADEAPVVLSGGTLLIGGTTPFDLPRPIRPHTGLAPLSWIAPASVAGYGAYQFYRSYAPKLGSHSISASYESRRTVGWWA
ncbi:MAG: hypothetical protein QOH59_2847 [Gemmatimonadales bacterium]|jgi:hypothetical protein|nr:hypothetical protein [Gemmatimonadales bacterium]